MLDTKSIINSIDSFTINIRMVSHSSLEPDWDQLANGYHYLGYKKLLGHRLKYMAFGANLKIVNPVFLSAAPAIKGYGLLNGRLYMPEKWFGDANKKRCQQNWVPEDLCFQTKLEISLDLIDQVKKNGLYQAKWIGCDATFGSDSPFFDKLPKDIYYFAHIRSASQVFTRKPKIGLPEYKRRGPHPTKMKLLPGQP